jgi:hypothetical protein
LVGLGEFWEKKFLFFYISCGLGAALCIQVVLLMMLINTLAANGFLRKFFNFLNQGKTPMDFMNAISKFH